ncbi:hypothetical protein DSECCO2_637700 [anaerobic digester metagenome]
MQVTARAATNDEPAGLQSLSPERFTHGEICKRNRFPAGVTERSFPGCIPHSRERPGDTIIATPAHRDDAASSIVNNAQSAGGGKKRIALFLDPGRPTGKIPVRNDQRLDACPQPLPRPAVEGGGCIL